MSKTKELEQEEIKSKKQNKTAVPFPELTDKQLEAVLRILHKE